MRTIFKKVLHFALPCSLMSFFTKAVSHDNMTERVLTVNEPSANILCALSKRPFYLPNEVEVMFEFMVQEFYRSFPSILQFFC